MKFLSAAGIGLLFAVLATGCRHGGLDNASGDLIDTLTERRLSLEFLYRPGLDLTRIGKPDSCRSPLNWLLCRDKCCGTCGNSCQSGCCQSAASCAQSTTDCCHSVCNQVCTAESVTEITETTETSVPILQSTWKNKTLPTSKISFEELPSPEEKKKGSSDLSASPKPK